MSLKDELRAKVDNIKQRAIQIKESEVIDENKEVAQLIIKEAEAIENLLKM